MGKREMMRLSYLVTMLTMLRLGASIVAGSVYTPLIPTVILFTLSFTGGTIMFFYFWGEDTIRPEVVDSLFMLINIAIYTSSSFVYETFIMWFTVMLYVAVRADYAMYVESSKDEAQYSK